MEKPVRVMLADDDTLVLEDLSHLIDWEAEGYVLSAVCENGRDALRCLESGQADMVIADIEMPVMDGLRFARKVHEDYPWIPVLLLTAYSRFDYAKDAVSAGVFDYALKHELDAKKLLEYLSAMKKRLEELKIQTQVERMEAIRRILLGEDFKEEPLWKILRFSVGKNVAVLALVLRRERVSDLLQNGMPAADPHSFCRQVKELLQPGKEEQNRINERIRKAMAEQKRITLDETPYGYRIDENQRMVPDPIPAEHVKFLFEKLVEYAENPPEELVQKVIDLYQEEYGEALSHEEAKGKVSYTDVKDYVAAELFLKNMAFQLSGQPQTAEALRKFLTRPFDMENPEKLLADYREKIGEEPPLTLWKQRMERMLGSGYCIGEITYYSRPEKHSILSWMKAAPITVSDHHKPIISKELYAAARERRQKERSKGNLTPEH